MGRCPFHQDKTPSFMVANERYYCFGCGARGDVIQFAQDYHKLTFTDAVKMLSGKVIKPRPPISDSMTLWELYWESRRLIDAGRDALLNGKPIVVHIVETLGSAKKVFRFVLGFKLETDREIYLEVAERLYGGQLRRWNKYRRLSKLPNEIKIAVRRLHDENRNNR